MHENPTTPLHLLVVTGSTREGRIGPTVARWFASEAASHPAFTVELADLADLDLPMSLPRTVTGPLRRFLDQLDTADAIVVVTPEYNHGYPASLKQAIDLARDEWRRKPVGIVSYGGRSGGIRAAEQLRQVFPELDAMTIREAIALPNVWDVFDDRGAPREPGGLGRAARGMLDQLAWWSVALRSARHADAVVAMSS